MSISSSAIIFLVFLSHKMFQCFTVFHRQNYFEKNVIAEDEMDIPEKIDPHGPIITLGIESEEVN